MLNCYMARQRAGDGRWAWTRKSGDMITPSGPCAIDCGGHLSKIEAERHFYDYELANAVAVSSAKDTAHKCEAPGCSAWATQGAKTRVLILVPVWMCPLHLGIKKDILEMCHQFHAEMEIWASV